jgi:hypothetical protein
MAYEERLLTLYVPEHTPQHRRSPPLYNRFADIHYYFCEPVPRPLHHRFDKASYVYLYRTDKNARLQIANHAGTPEQDAFSGCEFFRELASVG